jgi:hypothetical protein
VAIALVVLIAWNHPTPLTVLITGIVLLVYLAVIELLSRSAGTEQRSDAAH